MECSIKRPQVIRLIGCGGGGCRFIHEIFKENINGIECYAINTDAQDLINIKADKKILIGFNKTHGLGTGGLVQIGEEAAIENMSQINSAVAGSDVVFIICALGGGNSGAAPVVAKAAKDAGALTIVLVTLPFRAAGPFSAANAKIVLYRFLETADAIMAIPLDTIRETMPDETMEFLFNAVAKKLLIQLIIHSKELISRPGFVNMDFKHNMTFIKEMIMIDESIINKI
jgi:cell division protein FtsZ